MRTQIVNEHFGGGLVTSRPAHMLAAGELANAQGCSYRYDSLRLLPADPEKTIHAGINSGNGYDYNTLGFMQFDDGTAWYVTQTPATTSLRLFEAASGASNPTTTAVGTYTQSNSLVVVPFRNQHLVLNGAAANQVIYHTGGSTAVAPSLVQHGVNPVVLAPTAVIVTGAWPLGTDGLDQYYEYWVTESVLLADGTLVESDCASTGVVTTASKITSLTQAVAIGLPSTLANSNATYFNVYRSNGKANYWDKAFPVGVSIVKSIPVASAGTLITDGGSGNSGAITAGTVNAVSGWSATSGTLQTALATDNSSWAAVTVAGWSGTGAFPRSNPLVLSNFTFPSMTNPVAGILVTVKGYVSSGVAQGKLFVGLSQNGTDFYDDYASPLYGSYNWGITLNTSDTSYTAGGPTTTWNWETAGLAKPWAVGYFTPSGFALRIWYQNNHSSAATIRVNSVSVTVYAANGGVQTTTAFPAVNLTVNGDIASVGSNGKPPVASTACIFEDCLVCNDIAHPSYVWWGIPGNIHAIPGIYFNDMETPRNDKVTCLATVGSRVAIGMETCLYRINYLPTEADANFSRGQGAAFSEVDPSFGIVGPNAATTFVGPDGRTMLAFVSLDGLRISDLFSTSSACDDVDWRTILTPDSMVSRCVLVNNPRNYSLRLYYPAGDTDFLIKYMDFLYHPNHLKNGQFKAIGPVPCGSAAASGVKGAVAAPSLHSGYSWSMIEAWDGDAQTGGMALHRRVDPGTSGGNPQAMVVSLRDMFVNGFGSEWKLKDAYLLGGPVSSSFYITPSMVLRKVNTAPITPTGLTAVAQQYNPTKFSFNHTGSSIQLTLTTQSDCNFANYGWDMLAMEVEGLGREDSK
jgi:hypothetical protein